MQANEHVNRLAWWKADVKALNAFFLSSQPSSSSSSSSGNITLPLEVQETITTLRRTHFHTHYALRTAALALRPFVPEKASEVLGVLGYRSELAQDEGGANGMDVGLKPRVVKASRAYSSLFPALDESSGVKEGVDTGRKAP